MTEKEKMLSENLYNAQDEELLEDFRECRILLNEFNKTDLWNFDARYQIGKKLFGSIGEKAVINSPFMCDYGKNIYFGENFYMNYDCVILDVCKVEIGKNVMFGPRVSIYTAKHPLDAEARNSGLEYGAEVKIGDNVWLGGSVVVNPGVTIGNNVVVGSGSVVTKNIPDNVVVAGNPARIIKKITDEDKKYWQDRIKKYYEL